MQLQRRQKYTKAFNNVYTVVSGKSYYECKDGDK
jgi:hypothetical protein